LSGGNRIGRVRVRQHVNPLKSELLAPRTRRLPLPDDEVEVEVEVGCAEAQFLFERAERARQAGLARHHVGLEIRREFAQPINRMAESLGLSVRAYFSNVSVDLPHAFAPGRVARFFVNFPDPYFKRKQHKRRVMSADLVAMLHQALAPRGEIFFQSDVWELALEALDTFEDRDDLLVNRAGPWSFWKQGNPYGVRSTREAGCEAAGLPVWRILYDKRP
jgi:tRNA (guanine-N7-)-methyltransferase